jgi:DNA polymerase-4
MSRALCRDCDTLFDHLEPDDRCHHCASPRLVRHAEIDRLTLAHMDCDAFYATVEKRDNPALENQPVIVGGGRRGVVSAACYVARTYGVHSAMPMFKALKACPDAVVLRPDMEKYARVGRQVRQLMLETTPLVEPLSVDEAFLDLAGTERLHRRAAAQTLTALARRIEDDIGVTASIGLSYNKFLAKVASDLDKPRGFAVIGRAEALDFLSAKPVSLIWGVGKALRRRLAADGLSTIGQLRGRGEAELVARYGAIGRRLFRFAHGEDARRVTPDAPAKSISAETTFERDISDLDELQAILWPHCEKVAARLKRAGLAGRTVTLKLKTADFRLLSRSRRLPGPTRLAEVLYREAEPLLAGETGGGNAYRLIGIGASDLSGAAEADAPDLLDPDAAHRAQVEHAIDAVRAKLGPKAIGKGRGFRAGRAEPSSSPKAATAPARSARRRPRSRRN